MNDYQLTRNNLQHFFDEIQKELEDKPNLVISIKSGNTGKWGMARLWRAWMASTAKFMAQNGVTMPLMYDANGNDYGRRLFDANDAHELFTRQWLGVDENGERLSWSKVGNDGMRAANKGERWLAMFKHEQWALERGIILFKPRGSEYEKLTDEQNQ
jgi:hypothetical protein